MSVESSRWWKRFVDDCGPEKLSPFPKALAETLPIVADTTQLLDIGCGCGIIGSYCLLQKAARSVTFTDIMPEWIALARANVQRKIDSGRILQSQAFFTNAMPFQDLPAETIAKHDLIAFNPPQLPARLVAPEALRKIESDAIEQMYRIGSESGNDDGLAMARKFFAWFAGLPKPRPEAAILLSSFLGISNIEAAIASYRLPWKIIANTRAPLRDFFIPAADRIYRSSAAGREDRLLEKLDSGFTKALLTIKLGP